MTTANAALLPYQFNPMPHPSITHKMPELGILKDPDDAEKARRRYHQGYGEIYDESGSVYGSEAADKEFKTLRLGRIVMGEAAMTYALQEKGTRYGFRFQYNPSTMQGSQNIGMDFVPDPSDTVPAILQEGMEVITFQLLLNRVPEVHGEASGSDYPLPVSDFEMEQMRTRGTHYDLEYLYRCANGLHNTTFRQGTGDIGILLPNPVYLFTGPFRTRGALQQISVTDTLFSGDMVPMMTYVSIAFSRYLTMAPLDPNKVNSSRRSYVEGMEALLDPDTTEYSFAAILAGAVARAKAAITNPAPAPAPPADPSAAHAPTTPSSSGGSSSGPPAGKLTGAQVQALARSVGLNEADSRLMTQIAWAESGWNSKAHNPNRNTGDNSYGLWQINMIDRMGPERRARYGITSNEELWIPAVNARAMRTMYSGGTKGLSNWSAYTNGNYRRAPAW